MCRRISACHITTVHKRHDVRIFWKEIISLALDGRYEMHLLVADGYPSTRENGVDVIAMPAPSSRLRRMVLALVGVINRTRHLKAQIYHVHDPELLPAALMLQWLGATVVYDVHEDLPRDILRKAWIPAPFRKIVAWLAEMTERLVTRRLAGVVAATEHIAERFQAHNANTIAVCNYPSLREFPMPRNDRQRTTRAADSAKCCYVGIVLSDRGVERVLDAILATEFTLVVAGNIPEPGYEAELRRHPAWSQVDFLGWQNRDGVKSIMAECFAGIVTLAPTSAYIESKPVKLFEYMAAGLPVIASNFPLWRTIVEDAQCGICVHPDSCSEILQALRRIRRDQELAETFSRNGRSAIEQTFNWETESRKLVALYDNLLQASVCTS